MLFRLRLIRFTRRIRARRTLGFGLVGALLVVSVFANAVLFRVFDGRVDPDLTFGEALWYSVVSITTIGYGDYSAQTPGARLSTVVFIVLVGLSLFSVFFGMVIDGVNDVASRGMKGLGRVMASNHVLIVHFPSEGRVRQLIEEIRSDPEHADNEIIVISNQIEELPFRLENVLFVRGSTHDAETYRRASAGEARMAIVLSRDYGDPNSDAIVASAVSVIDAIEPDIHIVAECLHESHRELFKSVRCDAIVSGLKMAGNLLVREVHDPSISRVMEVLTSSRVGDTLYSTPVADGPGIAYTDLISALLAQDVNVLAVARGEETLTTFRGVTSQSGDRVVYVARRRRTWQELAGALSPGVPGHG